jgi:hypothetical protein
MKYQTLILFLLCHLHLYSQEDFTQIDRPTWKLNFIVSEMNGSYIPDLTFNVLPKEKDSLFSFSYSHQLGYIMEYNASISLTEDMILQVSHEMYEPISVELLRLRYSKRIYLGKKGMHYFRQGNLDLPFVVLPHKAGGVFSRLQSREEATSALLKKGFNIKIILDGSHDMAEIQRADSLDLVQADYLWLRESEIFLSAGPVINMYTGVFGFMDHYISIQFKNTTSVKKREKKFIKNSD